MEKLQNFQLAKSNDLDEARSAVSTTYLENRLTKLDGRSLCFSLNASESYDVTVGYLTYASEVSLQMPPSGDFYHVNLTTGGSTDAWRDDRQTWQTSTGESGVVLLPEHQSRVTWSPDAEQVIFRFSRRRLEGFLGSLTGREITRPIEFDLGLDLSGQVGASLFATAMLIVQEYDRLASSDGFTQVVRPMEELVMTQLLFASRHNFTGELVRPERDELRGWTTGAIDRRVRAAVDHINANLGEQISLESLARSSGMSIRSLHALFRSELATTPRKYIRDRRLDRVRQELRDDSGGDSVSSIASRWGFTHHGRFAASYRERFGELPRSTVDNRAMSK
ncbi:AraC family transcriptional regulator [Brevibacterium senegalense]|uniref:AraC family transcriptional regulator n=1 Tax=Brevibacterium senegalense TaxID=1033736 RepID=UPI00031D7A97|nr:AraC family transcriptional regulator [Brevibacterium senegalense]